MLSRSAVALALAAVVPSTAAALSASNSSAWQLPSVRPMVATDGFPTLASKLFPPTAAGAAAPDVLHSAAQLLFRTASQLEASEWAQTFLPIACYWVLSTLFYLVSLAGLTSVELHRISAQPGAQRPSNKVTVEAVIRRVLLQHSLQAAMSLVLVFLTRPDDMAARRMEAPWLVVVKLVSAALLMDTWQYWVHRWMHVNKWLYRHIHAVHHELTEPYAFGALYNHWLEGLLLDTVGGGVPALVLDMHPWTATLFFSIATIKTVDDHCGYALPWDPLQVLFPNNAAFHDIHHWGKGRMYNFSQPFFTFWDVWMGTHYEIAMAKKSKAAAAAAAAATAAVASDVYEKAAAAAVAAASVDNNDDEPDDDDDDDDDAKNSIPSLDDGHHDDTDFTEEDESVRDSPVARLAVPITKQH